MKQKNMRSYINYSWFLVGMVFLVIIAGGVVRMTQSGMGCPDWPKCFGMWIPPTSADQLPPDFEKYLSKQDIDHSFNAYHTWIEYINRLLGALLGFFILVYFLLSLRFRKTNRSILVVSFLLLLLVGFQGWLGKLVVDSNLSTVKITLHMVVAIIIAALPILNIHKLERKYISADKSVKYLQLAFIVLLLLQIYFGTQVRESIDDISKSLSYVNRELWISHLGLEFVTHRSFSWLLVIVSLAQFWFCRRYSDAKRLSLIQLSGIAVMLVTGVVMAYLDIPAIAQPIHLLIAIFTVVYAFYSYIRIK